MTAILASLLIWFGAAPPEARSDPCKMPAWALFNEEVALACDFDDARSVSVEALRDGYTGRRTHAKFAAVPLGGMSNATLVVSDRVVPENSAPAEVAVIGLRGGWLDGRGAVHGAYEAWVLPVAGTAAETKPKGTLVALYGQGELGGSQDVINHK